MNLLHYTIFLVVLSCSLTAQDQVWKSETDFKYNFALHLNETKQLKLAARELSSLDKINPDVDSIRLFWVNVLNEYVDYQTVNNLLNTWKQQDSMLYFRQTPIRFSDEPAGGMYFKSDLMSTFELGEFSQVIQLIDNQPSVLPSSYSNNFKMASYLALKDWSSAKQLSNTTASSEIHESLLHLSETSQSLKNKSPFLAASMSTVLPGSGKAYGGKWKDGLFALIFVTSNAFIAYRGFNRAGIKSPFGWVFSTVGFSFYVSNIYGSARETKQFNKRQSDQIATKAHQNLRNLY